MTADFQEINPESLNLPKKNYSQGVLFSVGFSKILISTCQTPKSPAGEVIYIGDEEKQTRLVFERIGEILKEADMSFDDVVKLQIFVKDINKAKIVSKVRDELFQISKPASTLVETSNLVKGNSFLQVSFIAAKGTL